jgi:hypothetical protein
VLAGVARRRRHVISANAATTSATAQSNTIPTVRVADPPLVDVFEVFGVALACFGIATDAKRS